MKRSKYGKPVRTVQFNFEIFKEKENKRENNKMESKLRKDIQPAKKLVRLRYNREKEKVKDIEDWCHFCLRIGYKDIKQYKKTKYSLCKYCKKSLKQLVDNAKEE